MPGAGTDSKPVMVALGLGVQGGSGGAGGNRVGLVRGGGVAVEDQVG